MLRESVPRFAAAVWLLATFVVVPMPSRAQETNPATESPGASTRVIENARIFVGSGFEDRTLFIDRGRLVDRRPDGNPEVLDLAGCYVVPAFGDAHTHRFASASDAAASRALFLDRGFLREGAPADIVVYDFENLKRVPEVDYEVVYDFPANEWRRIQRAEGYRFILVNGEVTFRDGVCTGATPGQLLRLNRWNEADRGSDRLASAG